MSLKKFIPNSVKLYFKVGQRSLRDIKNRSNFATSKDKLDIDDSLSLTQPIYYNPLSQNKVNNLMVSSAIISAIVIRPNETFSFWKLIGKPTPSKGYQKGRNIIGDSLKEDIGGGLCQISGMIYHLALIAGLTIEERFCHTIDLYAEDKRYTPIGTDATVVYGYKDIRFKNESQQSFQFSFETYDDKFIGTLNSNQKITQHQLIFERQDFLDYRTVDTYRIDHNFNKVYINQSKYKLPQ